MSWTKRMFIALDQGRVDERPAIAVVRSEVYWTNLDGFQHQKSVLVHLEQAQKGLSAKPLIERVANIARQIEGQDDERQVQLIINTSNQGGLAVELAKRHQLRVEHCVVTSGDSEVLDGDAIWRLPRVPLANNLDHLMRETTPDGSERFSWPEDVDLADLMLNQISDFGDREPKRPTLADVAAGREADDDGLVIATCLAVWLADKRKKTGIELGSFSLSNGKSSGGMNLSRSDRYLGRGLDRLNG